MESYGIAVNRMGGNPNVGSFGPPMGPSGDGDDQVDFGGPVDSDDGGPPPMDGPYVSGPPPMAGPPSMDGGDFGGPPPMGMLRN